MINPHGGTLINRIVQGRERDALLAKAPTLPTIELDAWALSDVEMTPPPAALPRSGSLGTKPRAAFGGVSGGGVIAIDTQVER